MNALTTWRGEVAEILKAAGVPATPYLPEVVRAPGAVLLHGNPYIAAGDTFGEVQANLVVVLVAATGPNEQATAGLDELLLKAAQALDADYGPLTVEEPAIFQSQQQNFLSARFTISQYFTLERT